jgi:hypothetical protein
MCVCGRVRDVLFHFKMAGSWRRTVLAVSHCAACGGASGAQMRTLGTVVTGHCVVFWCGWLRRCAVSSCGRRGSERWLKL